MSEGCNHVWVYANYVLTVMPPIYPKICALCGEKSSDRGTFDEGPTYDDIVKKFHGNPNIVSNESVSRFTIKADGMSNWGNNLDNKIDTNLYRTNINDTRISEEEG